MKLFMFFLTFITSFAVSAQSLQFKNLDAGQVLVKGSGFNKAYDVNFYKYSDYLDQIKMNSNGSFSYTTPRNTFQHGNKMVVKVLNYNGSGNHYERSWEYRKPTGGQGGEQSQEIPYEKLKNYANQQARTVANRVVNTYGEREKFKYNLVAGFWDGYELYRLYNGRGAYGYGAYHKGLANGRDIGKREGYRKGRDAASSEATLSAYSAVKAKFVAAVDTGHSPELSYSIPVVNYDGIPGDYYVPTVEEKLKELESDFRYKISVYRWAYDDYVLDTWGNDWTLRRIYTYNGTYEFVDSWFRSDYAYDEWKDNRLGGKYDYNIYKKLSSDQKYEYKKIFKSIYDDVIDSKFYRKKTERNPIAYALGQNYGYDVGREMAYQEGVRDGILDTHRASSIKGFEDNYAKFWEDSFIGYVEKFQNNPVLEVLDANVVGLFIPTGEIGVTIKKMRNIGGVDFNGTAYLSGESVDSVKKLYNLKLEALTSNLGKEINFDVMAKINNGAKPDAKNVVTLHLGDFAFNLSYEMGWENILEAFAHDNLSSSQVATVESYLLKQVSAEWSTAISTVKHNPYKSNPNETLIGRVANYVTKNSDSREKFSDFSEKAKEIPGTVYKIQFAKAAKKKAYMNLVNKIQ
ncbi:MAG: hypothetical protein H6621_05390 [Halobacteriovoraceae bacterium]|nr:hypothetical protein [Halobacteriovoraceae bacterium]